MEENICFTLTFFNISCCLAPVSLSLRGGGGRGAYIKKFLRVFFNFFLGPPKGGPNRNIGYIYNKKVRRKEQGGCYFFTDDIYKKKIIEEG